MSRSQMLKVAGLLFWLAAPVRAGAEEADVGIGTVWPMCIGRNTTLESWQWLGPGDLNAKEASEAIKTLAGTERRDLGDSEEASIRAMAYNSVEGYLLWHRANDPSLVARSDELRRHGIKPPIDAFCDWVTTHADPE